MVNTFVMAVLVRTPAMLATDRTTTTMTITATRQTSLWLAGTKNARYAANRLTTEANPARRATHINQPTSKPMSGPNATRVYRYGPPVAPKRLPTSAKQSTINPIASADTAHRTRL